MSRNCRLRLARPSPHGHFLNFHSVGDAQKGYLYPDHNVNECGGLTSACEQFFIKEGCFYECDKNLGKWRKRRLLGDGQRQRLGSRGVPIKASYCDAWYTAARAG